MNANSTPPGPEFTRSIFPAAMVKTLPALKKVRLYARRFDYEVLVNDEKKEMKFIIQGYGEEDIDFHISYSPVKWSQGPWPEEPDSKWFIFEKNSASLGFADPDMEYCICGFLFLLGSQGKKTTLKRIRGNRRKTSSNK
jgi:hypothetical protein